MSLSINNKLSFIGSFQFRIIYLDKNNLYGYATSKVLPTSGFKWIDSKDFDLNKYTSNICQKDVLSKLVLNILNS